MRRRQLGLVRRGVDREVQHRAGADWGRPVQAFQELWQIAYDQNVFIPLFGINFVHGLSPKLHWDPTKRNDLVRDFTQWTLDD